MSKIEIFPGDRVVLVVGPTGAGKSTFIARAANLPRGRINHNQRPHTSACHATRHKHPSSRRSTVLIDTPGFNSTGGDDTVVLERIGSYLAETCKRSGTVPIIVYLHNIQSNRMAGSAMRSLHHLTNISGPGIISNVVLVTTLWSELAREDIGVQREKELRTDYWRDLLARGCKYNRFDDNNESAWKIINRIDVQDSTQGANEIRRRFTGVQEQERQRQIHEETAKKSFLSKFLGIFKVGKK